MALYWSKSYLLDNFSHSAFHQEFLGDHQRQSSCYRSYSMSFHQPRNRKDSGTLHLQGTFLYILQGQCFQNEAVFPHRCPLLCHHTVHQSIYQCQKLQYKNNIMHQSFVSTAPPPTGNGGIISFHFQSPGISPALWGQADDNKPALRPALHKTKSHWVKFLNIITPALPQHCGDNKKVAALHPP